jgi:hypothetical protein
MVWDTDGDAVFLCHDPLLVNTRIDKTIIIDVDDKVIAKKQKYNLESIVDYEMRTRDNRIGEITNVATSILNQYTTSPKWQQINLDNISLLRCLQGHEIDFQKNGVRWQMSKGLRRYLQKLPYFLLFNYPKKLNRYHKIKHKNEHLEQESRVPSNAYRSPSPMNELCDYVCTWEKKHLLWDNSCYNTQSLLIDNSLDLSDQKIIKQIKHILDCFASHLREWLKNKESDDSVDIDILLADYRKRLQQIIPNNDILLANYVIKLSYSSLTTSKTLAWQLFSDVIIRNLKDNSPEYKKSQIIEVPYKSSSSREYLGKNYQLIEGGKNV